MPGGRPSKLTEDWRMNAAARKALRNAAVHNAAIDAVSNWLRAYAVKLRGQPVIGGVLADQLASEVRLLRRKA